MTMSFGMILPTMAQNENVELQKIQNDLNIKKLNFNKHFDNLSKKFSSKRDSIIANNNKIKIKNIRQIDSLKLVLQEKNRIFDPLKNNYANFKSISNLIENKKVAIVNNSKYEKSLIKITGINYTTKIIYSDENIQNKFYVISLDNSKSNILDIKEVVENNKISKIYNKYLENSELKIITKEYLLNICDALLALNTIENTNQINEEIKNIQKNEETQTQINENEINKFSNKSLNEIRTKDSLELNSLLKYYNIEYPNEISEYNNAIKEQKIKENKQIDEYNKLLVEYEKNINEITRLPTKNEAISYFNVFKRALKDPYSAILESYRVIDDKWVQSKHPCLKVLIINVRAKNSWGAYNLSDYFLVIKGGQVAYYGEGHDWMNYRLATNNVGCESGTLEKPIYPDINQNIISKPIMKEYNFSFKNL